MALLRRLPPHELGARSLRRRRRPPVTRAGLSTTVTQRGEGGRPAVVYTASSSGGPRLWERRVVEEGAGGGGGRRRRPLVLRVAAERALGALVPRGYPESVKPGYGAFAAWSFVSSVASSASGVLSTGALLQAVGVGDVMAAPLAAAANWAVKDGLGQLGGIAFATATSNSFDAEPRVWRMRSAAVLDAATLLELVALPLAPALFVPIAGLANVGKNVSFVAASATRAALHQSLSNLEAQSNLAEMTAKTASQSIVASLVGLGLVSNGCGGSNVDLLLTWSALSAVHLASCYASLRHVAPRSLTPARLARLAKAFLATGGLPRPADLASDEAILAPAATPIHFGTDLATACPTPADFAAFAAVSGPGSVVCCCRPMGGTTAVDIIMDAAADDAAFYRATLHAALAVQHRRIGTTPVDAVRAARARLDADPALAPAFVAALQASDWGTVAPFFQQGRVTISATLGKRPSSPLPRQPPAHGGSEASRGASSS